MTNTLDSNAALIAEVRNRLEQDEIIDVDCMRQLAEALEASERERRDSMELCNSATSKLNEEHNELFDMTRQRDAYREGFRAATQKIKGAFYDGQAIRAALELEEKQ